MFGTSRSVFKVALLAVCLLWASVNVGSLFLRSSTYTDLFAWWLAGQYVRQDIDPYTEFARYPPPQEVGDENEYTEGANLSFPIRYFDGGEDTQASLASLSSSHQTRPSNTAPVILLITILSYFSWPLASLLWFLFNLILVLGVVVLTFHYVEQSGIKITPYLKLLLVAGFLGLDATRSALQQGQTVVLVVFLGLLALYLSDKNQKILAGIALGIALSKFNVSLPTVFLLLLYRRQLKVIATAISTQVVAMVFVGLTTGTAMTDIIVAYADVALLTNEVGGASNTAVHLGAYLASSWNTVAVTAVLSLLILGAILFLLHPPLAPRRLAENPTNDRLLDVHILSLLTLMSLLAVYHIKYDIFSILVSMCLFAVVAVDGVRWGLSSSSRRWFPPVVILALVPLLVSFPLTQLIHNEVLDRLMFATQTISLFAMLVLSFWLLRRFLSHSQQGLGKEGRPA